MGVRKWVGPALFLAVAVGAGVLAVRSPAPLLATDGGPGPRAAVLSVRRAPELLRQFVADERLSARLDAFAADPGLGTACVVVRAGGRSVFELRAHELLTPASNLKLVTAVTALTRLGNEATLPTVVRARRAPVNGVVDGPLWLVGGGDPLLATKDYAESFVNQPQLRTPFEDLAAKVVAAGVREVRGGIIGDETRYDTQRFLPSWKRSYVSGGHVGPESALAVNDGWAQFTPRKVVADNPPAHAAGVLTELLRAQGVVVADPPTSGTAPAGLTTVATVRSPPIADIVGAMLRESDNNTAELLVKEMGRRFADAGTTAAGIGVVRRSLTAAKLPATELQAVDGSGLDRSDKASCHLLAEILASSDDDGAVRTGLAIAGETGTLADRFEGHPAEGKLRAKTGFLDGVVGLSGWMGDDLVFSFIANGLPVPTEAPAEAAQERLGAALATYPEAPSVEQLRP
jgi:serine-type D-Ala-D-Ala carboxypeptidase/endopeptidase (penicillin-binding protein 4)